MALYIAYNSVAVAQGGNSAQLQKGVVDEAFLKDIVHVDRVEIPAGVEQANSGLAA